ncbi:MAG: DUF1295 domain-containing protein [Saprospiraceae bacterium]|nr:DUF1295 domain-containing protein [Saprospiraceae bacterium]
MNTAQTASLLILTLLVLPVGCFYFGAFPDPEEWSLLKQLLIIALAIALLCFIVSEMTGNYSQVDKLWSLLPVVYVWIVTSNYEFNDRLMLMSILVTIWGVRLTYNFSLKGAYSWKFWQGEEDYRWKVLRQKTEFQQPWIWRLFNLGFICIYQNLLILLFTTPIIVAAQYNSIQLKSFDWIIALAMLSFITYETIADFQQWNFQKTKWQKIKAGEILTENFQKGFLTRGLWAYSRHPNYFAEQCLWICFYLFSATVGGSWINWSMVGCLLLILLFQGSARFSEEISSTKYPEYGSYQKKVPLFIPKLFNLNKSSVAEK